MVEDLQPKLIDPTTVQVSFRQRYQSDTMADTMTKIMVWQLINGEWMIVRESNR
jgi:adhesin transport system outer membrane protein